MSVPVSLAAYQALMRRRGRTATDPDTPRPRGELVWAHSTGQARSTALMQLGVRLAAQRPGTRLLLTAPPGVERPNTLRGDAIWQSVPDEHPASIAAFLDHWRPDAGLWTGGDLRPALLWATTDRRIPMFLADADEAGFDSTRYRWLPDLTRLVLSRFDSVLVRSANAAKKLRRLGVAQSAIRIAGALQEGSAALPCNEADRLALTAALSARPVWLAAMVQEAELSIIGRAHRVASRLAHRLLLIVVSDQPEQGPEFADWFAAQGWRVARWTRGEMPDESTQVLIAGGREELGLWYRQSAITLMSSSLTPGAGGRDPFEPAALGSAILYGPNPGRHVEAYARLAAAGAARLVKDEDSLSAAVSRLLAPDQAATMAHAGWEAVSAGAEVTDLVIELIQDALDAVERV